MIHVLAVIIICAAAYILMAMPTLYSNLAIGLLLLMGIIYLSSIYDVLRKLSKSLSETRTGEPKK